MMPSEPSDTRDVRILVLAALDDVSVDSRKAQGRHVAMDCAQMLSRAVGCRAERTAKRLLVDVGQVCHGTAVRRERRPKIAESRPSPHRRLITVERGDT